MLAEEQSRVALYASITERALIIADRDAYKRVYDKVIKDRDIARRALKNSEPLMQTCKNTSTTLRQQTQKCKIC